MKDDFYRLRRISETGHQLIDAIDSSGLTERQLLEDTRVQWMVTTPLYNIGEQANCLSTGICDANPDVPWAQIAGLRHRLVHDCEGINWTMISSIVFDELAAFIKQVDGIICESNQPAGEKTTEARLRHGFT